MEVGGCWRYLPVGVPIIRPSLYTSPRVVWAGAEHWGKLLRALVGMLVGENVTECTAVYSSPCWLWQPRRPGRRWVTQWDRLVGRNETQIPRAGCRVLDWSDPLHPGSDVNGCHPHGLGPGPLSDQRGPGGPPGKRVGGNCFPFVERADVAEVAETILLKFRLQGS